MGLGVGMIVQRGCDMLQRQVANRNDCAPVRLSGHVVALAPRAARLGYLPLCNALLQTASDNFASLQAACTAGLATLLTQPHCLYKDLACSM